MQCQQQAARAARMAANLRRSVSSQAVSYQRQGGLAQVLSAGEVSVGDKLGNREVLVRMLAAPVSALDMLAASGKIPGAPNAGVCGNEGVGVVEQVGTGVSGLKKGDHVVPTKIGLGTWSEYAVADEAALASVPGDLAVEQAAQLGFGPATALRVLADVASLSKGDAVVVGAAESVLGSAVVQIAKAKGLNVVGVVSKGVAGYKDVAEGLKAAGADMVIDEVSACSSDFRKACAGMKPKLAVHASASPLAATELARALAPGGTLVAVAGAGSVAVPSSLLIDRGITIKGFNLQESLAGDAAQSTVAELAQLVKGGKLTLKVASTESLAGFEAAIKSSAASPNGSVLLKM